MIDNETGKATRVNVWPMRLDVAIKPGSVPNTKLVSGWVMAQLTEAAVRLWSDFAVEKPLPPRRSLIKPVISEPTQPPPMARWRRRAMHIDDYDDDGGV